MKMNFLPFIVFAALLIASCQKEIDWGTGGGAANQLLVKISSKTGATDSTVITYSYDGQNRLIREVTTGISGTNSLDNDFTINRNASGIITTTVQKSPALVAVGVDSLVTRYNYNTTTNRYLSSVFNLAIPLITVTDSAVYTYDGSGRITSDMHYLIIAPLPAFQGLSNTYTYSSNGLNLTNSTQLAAANPGDPLSTVVTQDYTYDAKTNPLLLKNEGILLSGRMSAYSINNPKKLDLNNTIDATQSFTMDYTYKYNSAGKPDSSYGTRTPGGAITASKYFYQ